MKSSKILLNNIYLLKTSFFLKFSAIYNKKNINKLLILLYNFTKISYNYK